MPAVLLQTQLGEELTGKADDAKPLDRVATNQDSAKPVLASNAIGCEAIMTLEC